MLMERLKLLIFVHMLAVTCRLTAAEFEDKFASKRNISTQRLTSKAVLESEEVPSLASAFKDRSVSFQVPESAPSLYTKNITYGTHKQSIKRYDDDESLDRFSYRPVKFDTYWVRAPYDNFTARKSSIKKHDHSAPWPTWGSKKEIYHNNRHKKNHHKVLDSLEDYLGLDSKYHEMADRKYIHEHEGFFFPIHVPSHHHEKDEHLIPLLLLLLLPLLLFAIIIPLNANLLSTLFLIMQNNGATTTAAQLAAASGRRKRHIYEVSHPIVEEKIMEALRKISTMSDF